MRLESSVGKVMPEEVVLGFEDFMASVAGKG